MKPSIISTTSSPGHDPSREHELPSTGPEPVTPMHAGVADVSMQELTIDATDGHPLLATRVWRPPVVLDAPVVIVNGATGVPQRFYHRFARHLARCGLEVLTHDYAGIGRSLHGDVRDVRRTMREWGSRDFEGVLRYVRTWRPESPIHVVGHSVGGQLLGFAESNTEIERVVAVASQMGDYRLWPFPALLTHPWVTRAPVSPAFWAIPVPMPMPVRVPVIPVPGVRCRIPVRFFPEGLVHPLSSGSNGQRAFP